MECTCSVDYDEPDLYEARIIKARKRYRCIECGEHIEIGQKYERHRGFYRLELFWYTGATCVPCKNIRDSICRHGFVHEELRDVIMDCLGFDYTEDPSEWEDDDEDEGDVQLVSHGV